MERRLIVMRHAQSRTKAASDHDRRLTSQGQSDALEIAEQLVVLGWTPQSVISSDARRTRETWEVMKPAFEKAPPVAFEESLYLAGVMAVEAALYELDDDITDVLLLGHNPGWQTLVSYLSGHQKRMTPASAALLHGTGDVWEDVVANGNLELVQILRPESK